MPESLVLLHGFGGTHRAWNGVIARLDRERYLPLALDLPGHGAAAEHRRPITFDDCVSAVLEAAPPSFALCGYSLGGRVALHVALSAPERVSRLCILAADPGIEDASVRASRLAADERLARRLEDEPFEDFIERWGAQPLFEGDPTEVAELARADQRRNDPLALAAALRGLSVGAMAPLWERLAQLRMPVLYLAGRRDEKFARIGARLVEAVPHGRLVMLDGGHRLALENPGGVASALL